MVVVKVVVLIQVLLEFPEVCFVGAVVIDSGIGGSSGGRGGRGGGAFFVCGCGKDD